jgi:hypothetical protein
MANIFKSINRIVNRSSVALIDNQIPKKLSDVIAGSVTSTFEVVEDMLKVVKDVTEEEDDDEEADEEEDEDE